MAGAAFLYNLESLREIGWSHWDPIGLFALRGHREDEYDAYLLQGGTGHAVRGHSEDELGDFLSTCCHEMGAKADEAVSLVAARAIIAHVQAARAPSR